MQLRPCELLVRIRHQPRYAEDHRRPVVDRVMERRPRKHQPVGVRHGHTDRLLRRRDHTPRRHGTVQVQGPVRSAIEVHPVRRRQHQRRSVDARLRGGRTCRRRRTSYRACRSVAARCFSRRSEVRAVGCNGVIVIAPASGREWHAGTVHSRRNQVVHSWRAHSRSSSTARTGPALHLQLAEQFRAAVVDGRLQAGHRLPSTRDLAKQVGVSRAVAQAAYDQLHAEGWIEGRTGAGHVRHGCRTAAAGRATPRDGRPSCRAESAHAAAGHPVHRPDRLIQGGGARGERCRPSRHRAGTTMPPGCPRCGRRWPNMSAGSAESRVDRRTCWSPTAPCTVCGCCSA